MAGGQSSSTVSHLADPQGCCFLGTQAGEGNEPREHVVRLGHRGDGPVVALGGVRLVEVLGRVPLIGPILRGLLGLEAALGSSLEVLGWVLIDNLPLLLAGVEDFGAVVPPHPRARLLAQCAWEQALLLARLKLLAAPYDGICGSRAASR